MSDISKSVKIEIQGRRILYLCPKCKQSIQFENRIRGNSVCRRCRQHLDWAPVNDISAETITASDSDEVAWLASVYYSTCGFNEDDWIPIEELRHSLRGDGGELYFLFKDKKSHGMFMRKVSKEGKIYDG